VDHDWRDTGAVLDGGGSGGVHGPFFLSCCSGCSGGPLVLVVDLEMKKDHRASGAVVCSGGGGLEEEELSLWAFCPSKHIIMAMLAICHKRIVKNIRCSFKIGWFLPLVDRPDPLWQ